jgi:hypothetical protein
MSSCLKMVKVFPRLMVLSGCVLRINWPENEGTFSINPKQLAQRYRPRYTKKQTHFAPSKTPDPPVGN